MKYNKEYDRYVTKGGLVYRYLKTKDRLELCSISDKNGYKYIRTKHKKIMVHRLVWETFVGKITNGVEIDHKDAHKDNNELNNLQICTHKENMNNPLTKQHLSVSQKLAQLGNTKCEFGKKFKEHFGITKFEDTKLYDREWHWYKAHKKCRWE